MTCPRCFLLLLTLPLWAAACGHSPEPRVYTLVAQPAGPTFATASLIEVRRPPMAGYLDRRDIVLAIRAERLEFAADANWAEPLDAMLGRVLAGSLALRLPRSRVASDLSSLGVMPDFQVDVDLQRFERGPDGQVAMRALTVVRRQGMAASLEVVELSRSAGGSDTADTVATMSALLGDLADRLARTISASVASEPNR